MGGLTLVVMRTGADAISSCPMSYSRTEAAPEARLRRWAKRLGLHVRKMPPRSVYRRYYPPGYLVYNPYRGTDLLGFSGAYPFSATLDEVEAFFENLERSRNLS